MAADTDGTDGNAGAAGALISAGHTGAGALPPPVSTRPQAVLARNDSAGFFRGR